ncbi:hypothetical protein Droror1_Dr00000013 [Drosera rotundifolia]
MQKGDGKELSARREGEELQRDNVKGIKRMEEQLAAGRGRKMLGCREIKQGSARGEPNSHRRDKNVELEEKHKYRHSKNSPYLDSQQ